MPPRIEKPVAARGPFRLGEWLVEPSLNRLSRGETTIQLELKVMDVLLCLAERAGEVVARQEIVDSVWATEFIADNTLTHAITEIRNALGDDARDHEVSPERNTLSENQHRKCLRKDQATAVEGRPDRARRLRASPRVLSRPGRCWVAVTRFARISDAAIWAKCGGPSTSSCGSWRRRS